MESFGASSVILEKSVVDHVVMNEVFEEKSAPVAGAISHAVMPRVADTSAIRDFFSREISLGSVMWTQGSPIYYRLDPWTLVLHNATVKDKMRYYSRLRADVRIRLNISGTPFHYGLAMLTYRAHPGLASTSDPVYNLAVTHSNPTAATALRVVESQIMGVKFHPGFDSSVELMVPFLHYKPGIELTEENLSSIGTLGITELASLRHANGGTTGVRIEVMASLENVVLDVPTAVPLGFSLEGTLRAAGQWIVAGTKATKAAAEYVPAALKLAALLGASRPVERVPIMCTRPGNFQLANYDIPDTSERLALAADSEIEISGSSVGATTEDELMIASIAARPAFLLSRTWSSSDAPATFLMGSMVTPVQNHIGTYQKANYSGLQFNPQPLAVQTPVGFVASLFTHARFEMVYKFTVVCSPYHKGRLRIWYDPTIRAFASPPLNLTNSVVVDLAKCATVEVVVPWQNIRDAVTLGSPFVANTFTSIAEFNVRASAITSESTNGVLVCEVLNALVGPTDLAEVEVVLEVSARNMACYGPTVPIDPTGDFSTATDQDAVPYTPLGYTQDATGFDDSSTYDVSGADAVASLRQLLKRYVQAYVNVAYSGSSSGAMREVDTYLPIMLPAPGFNVAGSGQPQLDTSILGVPANYTSWTYRSYIAQAFALARGSIRWKTFHQNRNTGTVGTGINILSRSWQPLPGPLRSSRAVLLTSNTDPSYGPRAFRGAAQGFAGTQVGSISTVAPYLDVEFPFVSMYRALNARASFGIPVDDQRSYMNALLTSTIAPSSDGNNYVLTRIFEACGEDFSLFHFVHAPAIIGAIPTETPIIP